MPNRRNRIKSTGDTHLPDVGDERGGPEETVLAFEPAEEEMMGSGGAAQALPASTAVRQGPLGLVRAQVQQRPLTAVVAAFALGALLAR